MIDHHIGCNPRGKGVISHRRLGIDQRYQIVLVEYDLRDRPDRQVQHLDERDVLRPADDSAVADARLHSEPTLEEVGQSHRRGDGVGVWIVVGQHQRRALSFGGLGQPLQLCPGSELGYSPQTLPIGAVENQLVAGRTGSHGLP